MLGLASSGVHSNGYSLVRKIIEVAKPDLEGDFHGRKLADVLMAPTRIYVKPLLALMEAMEVKGMVHITGGGLVENMPRVLQRRPDGRAGLDNHGRCRRCSSGCSSMAASPTPRCTACSIAASA
jgi:phosphoribosylaminoimidazole (AIR) synthetase